MQSNSQASGTLESPQQLAQRLNLPFTDWMLLGRALTHRSYLNEHPEALEDNERLEFLGDAVLDFVVGAWLYNRYPEMPEGDLTRMRSALVHTEQLAYFAGLLNLGQAMRLGRGESQGGGRERPALLCDTFEAVIGALYLHAGVDAVIQFISPLLEDAAEDVLANHKAEDPKSQFQEWAQAQGYTTPIYQTRSATGPDHSKKFDVDVLVNGEIYGSGSGSSKQAAAKMAAQNALDRLGLTD
ncbi:ribonuclease III [Levilinea saccharolytica]|nr:ribonuclease III [Levilinea saccharolytica]GAP17724.1 ribonuclease III, bacterial [Levilinea saccharolytica]